MDHAKVASLVRAFAPAIKSYMAEQITPLLERNVALETRLAALEGEIASYPTEKKLLAVIQDATLDAVISVKDALQAEEFKPLVERVATLERSDVNERIEALEHAGNETEARFSDVTRDAVADAIKVIKEQSPDPVAPILTLEARVDALEVREPVKGPPGEPGPAGKDADPAVIQALVIEAVAQAVPAAIAELPKPKDGTDGIDGKDADPAVVLALVTEAVGKAVPIAVEAIPKPKDGKDAVNGKDADPIVTAALVDDAVKKAVANLPRPQDGKSVTVDELHPAIQKAVGEALAAIPKPKDGVGTAGAVIDQDGVLNLTLTDGTLLKLGRVVGRDALPGERGKDGFGFEHMEVVQGEERGAVIRFQRGEEVKEFPLRLHGFIDRGVFKEGQSYGVGDAVSFGGSLWLAQKDTGDKPETSDAWRLAVKRGRDGAPGKPHEPRKVEPVRA